MKVTIKISKCVRGGLATEPGEIGIIEFTPQEIEAMALKLYMMKEDINTDKFEYSASLNTIEI